MRSLFLFARSNKVRLRHDVGVLCSRALLLVAAAAGGTPRGLVGRARLLVVGVEVVLRLEVLQTDVAHVAMALLCVGEHVSFQGSFVGVVLMTLGAFPLREKDT